MRGWQGAIEDWVAERSTNWQGAIEDWRDVADRESFEANADERLAAETTAQQDLHQIQPSATLLQEAMHPMHPQF